MFKILRNFTWFLIELPKQLFVIQEQKMVSITHCKNVIIINLIKNTNLIFFQVLEIHRGDLDSYPYLGLLVLDDNDLQTLEEDALGRHEYLSRLWLNGNKLTLVPQSLPTALKSLYMEKNKIHSLRHGDFRSLVNLEELFLKQNNIQDIAYTALRDLVSLKILDLQANKIKNITESIFINLTLLETLDLSQNPLLLIGQNAFTGLSTLRMLQLSKIHTTVSTSESAYTPLKTLQVLEMYGSPDMVSKVISSTRLLQSLNSIHELNFMHNGISLLRSDFASFFPKLELAKLSGNVWNCSDPDKILWMKDWMLRSSVRFYRSYSIRYVFI